MLFLLLLMTMHSEVNSDNLQNNLTTIRRLRDILRFREKWLGKIFAKRNPEVTQRLYKTFAVVIFTEFLHSTFRRAVPFLRTYPELNFLL